MDRKSPVDLINPSKFIKIDVTFETGPRVHTIFCINCTSKRYFRMTAYVSSNQTISLFRLAEKIFIYASM